MPKFAVRCRMCKEFTDLEVTEEQIKNYQSGQRFVEDIFPELSPSDRELLISHTCSPCFEKLFEGEED